jgi:hypothetical protein
MVALKVAKKVALQQLIPTQLGEELSWTTTPPAAQEV